MALMGAMLAVQAGAAITNTIVGMSNAKKDAADAKAKREALETTLTNLEQERRDVVDNFEGQFSNTYANLGVATQAAEMQIEQTDIALANTLDTIRATGGAAGGATALAQAALSSKKGVSASIEKQEVANEKLRAEGEAVLQQKKLEEGLRAEARVVEQLDRTQALADEQRAREMQAVVDRRGAFSSGIGALGDMAGSLAGAGISSGQFDLGSLGKKSSASIPSTGFGSGNISKGFGGLGS
tara:strand:- start:1229 stop:1951 length:723 start_codon:yes stop_codon:yes gene_type:complete